MEAIKTENLTKYYGKSRGVLELNLSVEQGEVFGFIGPNWSSVKFSDKIFESILPWLRSPLM